MVASPPAPAKPRSGTSQHIYFMQIKQKTHYPVQDCRIKFLPPSLHRNTFKVVSRFFRKINTLFPFSPVWGNNGRYFLGVYPFPPRREVQLPPHKSILTTPPKKRTYYQYDFITIIITSIAYKDLLGSGS